MADLPLAALLGRGARYSGEMAFEGRVRVDGHFTGRIVTEDVLEVGESGVVEGEIDAATLVIAGSVKATVRARDRIVVQPTGQLAGKADCSTLEVAPGARISAELRVGGG
ncbi:MAG: polymer-forming cytoskeletal protein [Deltaproteobacteria bacterium]|nr:polymer-forming cytoskeletal protein [Deltaproteobacteria bacterium]